MGQNPTRGDNPPPIRNQTPQIEEDQQSGAASVLTQGKIL